MRGWGNTFGHVVLVDHTFENNWIFLLFRTSSLFGRFFTTLSLVFHFPLTDNDYLRVELLQSTQHVCYSTYSSCVTNNGQHSYIYFVAKKNVCYKRATRKKFSFYVTNNGLIFN